jgi:hypothetical protein
MSDRRGVASAPSDPYVAAIEQLEAELSAANSSACDQLSRHKFACTQDNVFNSSRDSAVVGTVSQLWQHEVKAAFDRFRRYVVALQPTEYATIIAVTRNVIRKVTGLEERRKLWPQTLVEPYSGWLEGGWPRLCAQARFTLRSLLRTFERQVVIAVHIMHTSQREIERATANQLVPPEFWHALESRFRALQPKDSRRDLIADWISTSWNDGTQWFIHGASDEKVTENFEMLAERAALRLGHKGGHDAVMYWLEILKGDTSAFRIIGSGTTHEKDSRGVLRKRNSDSGVIERLCEASADYCLRLENQEMAARAYMDRQSLPSSENVIAGPDIASPIRSEMPALIYRSAVKRAILAQLVQQPHATDIDICRSLDADGGVDLPTSWRRKPGDRLFADAYKNPGYRRKIEITISKVRSDLRKRGILP